mgnify:CR=1 FL=1
MAKVNVLRRLRIKEISSVDRGAGEGVKIMLMKRGLGKAGPIPEERGRRRGHGRPRTLFEHQAAARAPVVGAPSRVRGPKRGRRETMKELTPALEAYLARNVVKDAEAVEKREFSAEERRGVAERGHALSGGGFPIESVADLENAIHAIGRAKNPEKARAHVRRQAARLGRTDLVPEGWSKTMKQKKKPAFAGAAPPFDEKDDEKDDEEKAEKALLKAARSLGKVDAALSGVGLNLLPLVSALGSASMTKGEAVAIRDACRALRKSIASIVGAELQPAERAEAVAITLSQFAGHLATAVPQIIEGAPAMAKLEKRLMKAFTSGSNKEPPAKDGEVHKKDEAVIDVPALLGEMKKTVSGLETDLKLWKRRALAGVTLSTVEKAYLADCGDDMDEDEKMKFLDLGPAERLKYVEDNPVARAAEKRLASLPEPVRKQLEEGRIAATEVAKMTDRNEAIEFAKRAGEVGQPATFGSALRILAKSIGTVEERQKAFEEVMKALGAYAEQARTAGLFGEFGSASQETGSAYQQLTAKAQVLVNEVTKTNGARPMTIEQAFTKIYEDPQNAALVQQYKREQRRAA